MLCICCDLHHLTICNVRPDSQYCVSLKGNPVCHTSKVIMVSGLQESLVGSCPICTQQIVVHVNGEQR